VGTVNSYISTSSGSRRLRVTAAGSKTDVRLDITGFALGSATSATLVLTSSSSGVLVNALWVVKRGGLTVVANTQSRVRVAAAVADGATVAVTLGASTLLGGVGAPAVGSYNLVTASSVTPAVTVNGASVSTTAQTLEAGADYTLLIHGPSSAPLIAWLVDDNSLPSDTSQVHLRLVHALSDQSAALALKVDALPVASDVLTGTASAYAAVTASAAAALAVTATGISTAVFTATDQVLTASGVYTLFITGSSSNVAGVLRKDR
jgi:hypothetical protein